MTFKRIKQEKRRNPQQIKITAAKQQQRRYLEEAFWDFKVRVICGTSIQALDVYYAKPRLLQKNDTKEIGAFYALTEECESVFPVRADGFLNLSKLKITEWFVQFVLYSENRVLERMFPYGSFIEEMRRRDGVRQFDADHILIPPMTKAELEELAGKLY